MGLAPAKWVAAKRLFTTATFAASARSRWSNLRPMSSGIPAATTLISAPAPMTAVGRYLA